MEQGYWHERIARKWAIVILAIVTIITVGFIYTIINFLEFDYDFENFFPRDDEETEIFLDHREQFGSDNDFILIAIKHDGGVFNMEFLERLNTLKKDLQSLNYIDSVITPLDLAIDKMQGGVIGTKMHRKPLLRLINNDTLRVDSIRIMNDERYVNSFFSNKSRSVSIFVKTEEYLNKDACDYLGKEVPEILDKYDNYEIHYAGRSVGQSYYIQLMQHDLMVFISLSIVLIIIFLIIAFKSVWGVAVPTIVVILANIWILGIMAVIGEPVNLVLTTLPTIIFVVGMSDVVHIVSRYLEELRAGRAKMDAIRVAFKEIGLATLLTSVTTAIGFLTLIVSPVEPLQTFGIFTSLGVMVAFILAFTVLPSVLILMKPPKLVKQKDIWKRILRLGYIFTLRHPVTVLLISLVVIGISVFFASQIEQNNYLLEDLRPENEMKQHFTFFEDHFAGVRPFEMQVSMKDTASDILSYEVLLEMEKMHEFIKKEYGTEALISPVVMVKSMHQADWLGLPDKYTMPSKEEYRKYRKIILRYIDKYKRSLSDTSIRVPEQARLFTKYIDTALQSARFTGRMGDWGSKHIFRINDELENYYRDSINTNLIDYSLTGTAHLIDKNNAQLAKNMIGGLLIAFILVALIMGLLYRSLKMIVVALIPNIIPLVVIAGLLGVSGTDLKVSISIVFTIAFGICVDDTIHFMSKLKLERMKGRSMLYALKRTYLSTGKAIIITSLILCSGFLLLIFSEFLGTFYIGYLISITLFVAVIADLFLLPALLIILTRGKE